MVVSRLVTTQDNAFTMLLVDISNGAHHIVTSLNSVRIVLSVQLCQLMGRRNQPPLHPILVQPPFQTPGVDIMELLVPERGNLYVIMFRDFQTNWPLVFPVPDQKAIWIAKTVD